ncbi:hypothetical protein C9J12_18055 [Photobacterium frigidiphilum]|uniref:Uncharacterized protein n=1 Tax=Photobacterium frigidiphilum TaxID=264736 RepID=A0A2T3JCL9_9GAMM|nr:ABC-three component system middle component 1 [Photobacterium frigidiphilum]PSU46614.1 hypothetical protein C9J12_18055 [Photobacterium frigidiphilum]
MMLDIICSLFVTNDFELMTSNENILFFKCIKKDKIRYFSVVRFDVLPNAKEINNVVLSNRPEEIRLDPASSKNTDVLVLFNIGSLHLINEHEGQIFEIEEDPLYFKKHVLYYTDDDVSLLVNKSLEETLINKVEFNQYKKDASITSIYSIIARIYIKLPFLKIPYNPHEYIPLEKRALDRIENKGLIELFGKVESSSKLDSINIEDIVKGLVKHEMENI